MDVPIIKIFLQKCVGAVGHPSQNFTQAEVALNSMPRN